MRVLDVGCSDGRGSEVLSRAQVHGVDIYRPTLEARAGCRTTTAGDAGRRARPPVRRLARSTWSCRSTSWSTSRSPMRSGCCSEMERVSRSTVVVVTPKGFVPQPGTADEPWQEHKCGFDPAELEAHGYEVAGIGGPAALRGPYGTFRGGPFGQAATAVCVPAAKRRPGPRVRARRSQGVAACRLSRRRRPGSVTS